VIRWAGVTATALLVGCAGFPAKQQPLELSSSAPLAGLDFAGGGEWPAEQWWTRYQDPTLDALIAMGLANSPTLINAHARFDSARQSVRLAAAASGAHLDANADITRQRLSDNGLFPPQLLGFSWYNQSDLGVQATYVFDWWGKQRHAVEAAMDEAHAAQAERSAAALLLAGSIADTYFGWQADQTRLALSREKEIAVAEEGRVTLERVRAELEPPENIDRTGISLAAVREQSAQLEGSARLRVVVLAALVGKSIAELPALQVKTLPSLAAKLPDTVTLDLIARRADITASRWRVEAAQRNVDSARAEFFPDVSLNVLLGWSSVDVGKLLEYSSRVPEAGAAIHLPIFDAGRVRARYGGAQAAVEAAASTYQDTVIGAARDVAMQVTTQAQLAAQRAQRAAQLAAAVRLKHGATARVRQGLDDTRSELEAAEFWIDQRDGIAQLDAAAISADIALQRALGGGYESTATKQ
jgi:multidrug efflux system outer membrane protein